MHRNFLNLIFIVLFFITINPIYSQVLLEDSFDNDGIGNNLGEGGIFLSASSWSSYWEDAGDLEFYAQGTNPNRRALAYSENSFMSETGFVLTSTLSIDNINAIGNHNFSIGFISAETDLANYTALNPFAQETNLYSLGINLTSNSGANLRGLNFTNNTMVSSLDTSGTANQFVTNTSFEIVLEIGQGGVWKYYIDGVFENSGKIPDGFDLSKAYHIAIYAQDEAGGNKKIESIKLEKALAIGERLNWLEGTWGLSWTPSNFENGLVEGVRITDFLEQIEPVKTLDYIQVKLGSSYIYSPVFGAPHDVIESLWEGDVDANGDLINLAVPRASNPYGDPFLSWIQEIKAAGLKVHVYVNSSNMLLRYDASEPTGRIPAPDVISEITDRWMNYCDANYQNFIDNRAYHTGIYNTSTSEYENAETTFPERKYMFCFAEYILKEYAVRYGDLIDAWVFDSGEFMEENGDNNHSGILEEQRIYEAFTLAVREGNPNAGVSFNNGPNRLEDNAANGIITPFSKATCVDDFMFGHPYNGGSNIGKDKDAYLSGGYPTNYGRNFAHMLWMEETDGDVHTVRDLNNPVNEWDWDDKVIGHFYPPMSTTSWAGGNTAALEQVDFNLWTEKVVMNKGAITWGVALDRANLGNTYGGMTNARDWAYDQIIGADEHLCGLPNSMNNGAPVWYRGHTNLPTAFIGNAFYHVLVEGEDFWDPEGDDITALTIIDGPSWLSISEEPLNSGNWVLSGTPPTMMDSLIHFQMIAVDANGLEGERDFVVEIEDNQSAIVDLSDGIPVWVSNPIYWTTDNYQDLAIVLKRGLSFEDFDGDILQISMVESEPWISLVELAPNVWGLIGETSCSGIYEVELALTDGTHTVYTIIEIEVIDPTYLEMETNIINGTAQWIPNAPFAIPGEYTYNNSSSNFDYRSILYSQDTFQSDQGFRLTVNCTVEDIDDNGANSFAFGLLSTETNLSNYIGFNPFGATDSIYSIGVNMTAELGTNMQGLNFADGTIAQNLDESGTNIQFPENITSEIILEILPNGHWNYSIDGIEEAAGIIANGFDLTKEYVVAFYGQDDNGGLRSIQSFSLSTCIDCMEGAFDYAITDGTNNTTNYLLDSATIPVVDVNSSQQYGLHRSTLSCEEGTWRNFYNINEPDKYLFSIEMGSNTTEIDYVDIQVDQNPSSRYDSTSTSAIFVMERDWHVATVGGAALTAPVNIRFYYPPSELQKMLNAAIALSNTDPSSITPTATNVVWFKKDVFDSTTDIDATGNTLLSSSGYLEMTPLVAAAADGVASSESSAIGNNMNYVQFNNVANFSGGTAYVMLSGTALPVELSSFKAMVKGCDVDLVWMTESEIDFDYFEIEWSSNGQDFRPLKIIEAKGGDQTAVYQYKDKTASYYNYYRLKMVDLDGSFKYSNIEQANTECEDKPELSISPNPVGVENGILNVKFYSKRNEVQLQITDMLGRVVKRLSLDVEVESFNALVLDISDLPSGNYTIQLLGDRTAKMFIIQE